MPENSTTTHNTSDLNGSSSGAPKQKRTRKKQLPNVVNSANNASEITIKAKVSTYAQSVSNVDFPLYKPFVLSAESTDLYIKVTKHCIVNLSTLHKFAANVTGYLVII